MSDKLIEAVARSLWGAQKDCPKEHFDHLTVPTYLREEAAAALAAIEAAGYAVVPKEPTREMLSALYDIGSYDILASDAYAAMLAAAPKVTP